MNEIATLQHFAAATASVRPQRLARDSFEAWHASGVPIDVTAAETLDEAVNLAAPQSCHKGNFVIQHTRADLRRFLHFYTVIKSTKRGTYRDNRDTPVPTRFVFEGNLEPKPVFRLQVLAPLQPVAPWKWSQDDYMGEKHGICPDLVSPLVEQADG